MRFNAEQSLWLARLAGVLFVVSSWGNVANAAAINVWSTGVANNGQLLPAGTVDPHYSIVQATSYSTPIAPRVTSNNPTNFPWAANTPTSQWINPSGQGQDLLPAGYYCYETTFDLTGFNSDTAQIVGNVAVDNALAVYFNGSDTGIGLPWAASSESPLHPFSLTTGFVNGINRLVFEVYNGPQPNGNPDNPTGLQVQITEAMATAAVPLPSTLPAGMALLGMWGLTRRLRYHGRAAPAWFLIAAGGVVSSIGPTAYADTVGWGDNSWGQLNVPVGVDLVAASLGQQHGVGIKTDGTLAAWGTDSYGQVSGTPSGTFTAVAAGRQTNYAIRSDGTLAAWGNPYGGATVVPSGQFTAIAAGDYWGLGIRTDGTLAAWGCGALSEYVPSGTFSAIAQGQFYSYAIASDGTLISFPAEIYAVPYPMSVPDGKFKAVTAGESNFGIAIRDDGTLVGWGDNTFGQINVPSGKFKAVTAGNDFAIGLREDGTLVGWGNSAYGQINVPAGVYSAIAAGPISTAGVAMAATSVPLPSAGLAGMALLTALGVVRQVRPWKS